MKMRPVAFLLTAAVALAVFVFGLYREEIGEVLFNAAIL